MILRKKSMNNVEECKRYIKKQEMLGKRVFEFKCDESKDKVELFKYYESNEEIRRIVIPDFVTDIKHSVFWNVEQSLRVVWRNNQCKGIEALFMNYHGEELDLSEMDTKGVENMRSLFAVGNRLRKININGWDTSKVICMDAMFYACNYVEEIDMSGLDKSSVRTMESMFQDCKRLKKVELGGVKANKLKNVKRIFYGCPSLEYIDISSFNKIMIARVKKQCEKYLDMKV